MENERHDIIMRLKRIEGQVRGLTGMIQREAPCLDVLTQVGAITAAMKKVGAVILQSYLEECLARESSGEKEPREALREFQKAVSRYINWA